jgi:Domain of unknown function (DUF4365)
MPPQTERLGIASLDHYFSSHGWLFREQPTHDYGIDAHVEIVEEGNYPTGKLIAMQIKSGMSFISEETPDAYVFRSEDKHVSYWLNHSMPVILVLYNPDTNLLYWEHIHRDTVKSTGKNWKLLVPKANVFVDNNRTLRALAALTQPEPYIRKLNRLRIDKRWIKMVEEGQEVRVQFDDWVNKSLTRTQLTVSSEDETQEWPMTYAPGMGVLAILAHYIPWADFSLDREAHREAAEEDWSAQCSRWDSDTREVFYIETFDEWYTPPADDIVPVSDDGETESYSLLLSLNELGKAFLTVDEYLADPSNLADRMFTF